MQINDSNTKLKLVIMKFVNHLSNDDNLVPYWGICRIFIMCLQRDSYSEIVEGLLRHTFITWPEFSGNLFYPINTPLSVPSNLPHGLYYYRAKDCKIMWDTSTEYGRSRHRLRKHVIEELLKYCEKLK